MFIRYKIVYVPRNLHPILHQKNYFFPRPIQLNVNYTDFFRRGFQMHDVKEKEGTCHYFHAAYAAKPSATIRI